MAERDLADRKIPERDGAEHAIVREPTDVAAFVGRTLKGPVNRPVAVASFAEFRRIFGGLWQPSTVSYALEQFFDNGGRRAVVVRVVNGARPPTLTLPGRAGALQLQALNPGSREYLRASVDYDGIGESEADRFNLVVQRVREPDSERIEDQEIFRRLSVAPDSDRFVADVLLDSHLCRAAGPVPPQRPDRSLGSPGSPVIGYVHSNPDGDDGGPLTDYDVIGSAVQSTGLFALERCEGFNLLCIPPLARDQDVGLSTLLVAARLCRERHAMLLVDPPATWTSTEAALEGLRSWPFRSENAAMYFPRILAFDRLRGRLESFGSCAAAAGMIARADETWPVWAAAESEDAVLRPGLRPALTVTEADRMRLAHQGVNTLLAVRASARRGLSPRTLTAGSSGTPDWRYLSARRLALFIMASIERGTRALAGEPNGPATWQRARRQVEDFLDELDRQGAFAGARPEESYFVICDERLNGPEAIAKGTFMLLFGFAIARPGDFHPCLVTHTAGASRVRPVSVNRLATPRRLLDEEFEASILRGVSARL